MSDMNQTEARERIAIRLPVTDLARVQQLAIIETEGNVSQMIRKLLNEALATRKQRRSRP